MGNEQSNNSTSSSRQVTRSTSGRSSVSRPQPSTDHPGIPFVSWKGTFHFAEPSSYKFTGKTNLTSGKVVFVNPKKADDEIRNAAELLGSVAIVYRGGRIHFPDIIRRLLQTGIIGCIFIEQEEYTGPKLLFDGFHSSGRQKVSVPIVRLSLRHAQQFLKEKPTNVSIEFLSSQNALKHIIGDDLCFGISTSSRLGDVVVLQQLLTQAHTKLNRQDIPVASALCDAAENGHVDCIEALHGVGISLDESLPNGTSPLMMACSVDNSEVARALLVYGATIDLEDVYGNTALIIAARDGAVDCLRLLIRKGASINLSRNRKRGTTALHVSARSGREDCLQILIEAKADLETLSPNSTTALMEAARAGKDKCVEILAEAGANLLTKDKEGNTAEMIAAMGNHTKIENYLREKNENDSIKDQRRQIEDSVQDPSFTLRDLLALSYAHNMDVDMLKREITRNPKTIQWLEKTQIIYDVFKNLTVSVTKASKFVKPISSSTTSNSSIKDRNNNTPITTKETLVQLQPTVDSAYGHYRLHHLCCEIALWYDRKIFETNVPNLIDYSQSCGYLKVLFNFLCHGGTLDDVLVVLFCKVVNHYVNNLRLGAIILHFFGHDQGQHIVPWLGYHIGIDSIRDTLVWILYSDLTPTGQQNVVTCNIFNIFFDRLYAWQRTLSWGVGTAYQRDCVENICSLFNYIIFPPAVYVINDVATFVDNTDFSLPLITDRAAADLHNEILRTLMLHLYQATSTFDMFLDLGLAELNRQIHKTCPYILQDGGVLSVLMMLMSTLGYHKKKRDTNQIENLLRDCQKKLVSSLIPRVNLYVQLCMEIVSLGHSQRHLQHTKSNRIILINTSAVVSRKGNTLLCLIALIKRCVFLQHGGLNESLSRCNAMPCLLACFESHPNNSLLHHEITDIIRFILLDPDQKRLPSCPLLNSLFMPGNSILDFVMKSYNCHVQYKGHLTTIANSVFTLTNTPIYSQSNAGITCEETVRQYTSQNQAWMEFEKILSDQNFLEMQPLGQRNAPLCSGCKKLKESAIEYVTNTLSTNIMNSGYLETIFSGNATFHCKVNIMDEFITGYVYKKDKIHDHIPVPEPTRASSFIQFPVAMPFHALTFTLTYFALCRKCDKVWYCDTLNSPNWQTRMKWVVPTSVRKWYSFGTSKGPGSGAHGIQFTTKGYKNFLVLTDTWGRQEQWIRAIEEAINGYATGRHIDAANALAIEIDNEADNNAILGGQNDSSKNILHRARSHTVSGVVGMSDKDNDNISSGGSNHYGNKGGQTSTTKKNTVKIIPKTFNKELDISVFQPNSISNGGSGSNGISGPNSTGKCNTLDMKSKIARLPNRFYNGTSSNTNTDSEDFVIKNKIRHVASTPDFKEFQQSF